MLGMALSVCEVTSQKKRAVPKTFHGCLSKCLEMLSCITESSSLDTPAVSLKSSKKCVCVSKKLLS